MKFSRILAALIVSMLIVTGAFAGELSQVKEIYTFPLGTVASATVNSVYGFTAPCDMRIAGIEVYSVGAAAIGTATDSVVFTIYDDGVAIQTYDLTAGALSAATPKAFTLSTTYPIIEKDSVVKCSAVVRGDSRAVTTPVVNLHWQPTR